MAEVDFDTVKRWDSKNPDFYRMFKRFALEAINSGCTELGGWLIANRIRWETTIRTEGSDWKVPNGCIAYYTRLFMVEYPQYGAFFRIRKLKSHVTQEQLKEWSREKKRILIEV